MGVHTTSGAVLEVPDLLSHHPGQLLAVKELEVGSGITTARSISYKAHRWVFWRLAGTFWAMWGTRVLREMLVFCLS